MILVDIMIFFRADLHISPATSTAIAIASRRSLSQLYHIGFIKIMRKPFFTVATATTAVFFSVMMSLSLIRKRRQQLSSRVQREKVANF